MVDSRTGRPARERTRASQALPLSIRDTCDVGSKQKGGTESESLLRDIGYRYRCGTKAALGAAGINRLGGKKLDQQAVMHACKTG